MTTLNGRYPGMNLDQVEAKIQSYKQGTTQVVCSWCKRDMGTKSGCTDEISHGCCQSCLAEALKEIA